MFEEPVTIPFMGGSIVLAPPVEFEGKTYAPCCKLVGLSKYPVKVPVSGVKAILAMVQNPKVQEFLREVEQIECNPLASPSIISPIIEA